MTEDHQNPQALDGPSLLIILNAVRLCRIIERHYVAIPSLAAENGVKV